MSRGLANLSGGIRGTLIPLLLQIEEEKRRTAEREESTGLRERYLNIAEEGAARSQQEFDSEQALLKEPVYGRIKQLSDMGIKVPFPAQTTADVQTLQGLGVERDVPLTVSISRLMEMVANEKQAREKAASQEKRDIREQEADISGKEALATQRLGGGEQEVPADVIKAVTQGFLGSREVPAQFNAEGYKTAEGYTPPLVGKGHNAPDSLMTILSGLTGGQQQPTDTSGVQPQGGQQTIQGLPPMFGGNDEQWGQSNITDWNQLDSRTKQAILAKARQNGELR